MFDRTPWLVHGGVEHTTEVARFLAYIASSGSEGVATSADLKVSQANSPGAKVQVAPGGAVIINKFEARSLQSYAVRNPVAFEVPITPTLAGQGRTDILAVCVLDHNYAGTSEPADVNSFQFVVPHVFENVGAGAVTPPSVPLANRTYLPLARITLPPGTSTVTDSMITDLRWLAMPHTHTGIWNPVIGDSGRTLINTPLNSWGSVQMFSTNVRDWVTRIGVQGDAYGVIVSSPDQNLEVDWQGDVRLRLVSTGGTSYTPPIPVTVETESYVRGRRVRIPVSGFIEDASKHAGRTVTAHLDFRKTAGHADGNLYNNRSVYGFTFHYIQGLV